MVECAGKLLLVSRSHVFVDNNGALEYIPFDGTLHRTDSFKTYELDLKESSLVEITIPCLSVLIMRCVYRLQRKSKPIKGIAYTFLMINDAIFGMAEAEGGLDMAVFSLDDMSIEPHYPCTSESNFSMPIWVMPTV